MIEHNHLMAMVRIGSPVVHEEYIERWMRNLVADLGMEILIPPKAVYCETIGNRGMTCICAINTSHIVVHTWDEDEPTMQLDVYTCAPLELDVVWKAVDKFNPIQLKYKFYDRQGGFTLVEDSGGGQ
jgi:S-adenosylmethionine/arginine decarboxylase-like enzyme